MVETIHYHEFFFDNNMNELVHLDWEEYGKINHEKFKHFHNG
jgi:hypothetical protein